MSDTGVTQARLRLPLVIKLGYVLLGAFWGCWAISLPLVKQSLHLSDAGLGWLLAVAVSLGGLGGTVVGRLARRLPARRMMGLLLGCFGLASLLPSQCVAIVPFASCFALAHWLGGCVDAGTDASAAVYLRGQTGSMVRFHALFNMGCLAGGGLMLGLVHAGASWRWGWPIVGILAAVLGLVSFFAGEAGLRLDGTDDEVATEVVPVEEMVLAEGLAGLDAQVELPASGARRGAAGSLRADGLLGFLALFMLAEVTEGGAFTWGVLFLREHLAAGLLVGAGAYAAGHLVSIVSRLGGGTLLQRRSVALSLFLGAALCAVGLVTEVCVHSVLLAAVGLALAVIGVSLFWPLVIAAVSQRATNPAKAVGSFTASGYVGWVAGAPLVGSLAAHLGLGAGLWLMAGICVVVCGAVLLGAVPGSRGRLARRRAR